MRRVLLLCLGLAAPLHGVSAQQGDTVRLLFDRAHRGNWFLRVHLADSSAVEGRVPFLRAERATVGRANVRLDSVTALERRQRVGSGARHVGIATGLLTGGFMASFYSGFCEGQCSGSGLLGVTAAGFGTGFALGAFLGAVIDPGRIQWRPLFPPAAVAEAAARPDSAVSWSPRVTTLYIAGAFAPGDVPPLIPYLYGVQFASQRGPVEVTFLDIFVTWDGPAQGLDAAVGANVNISETNYIGLATGVADLLHDYRTIVMGRLGVHNVVRPGIRLEARVMTPVREADVVGYLVVGYDVRRRR